MQQLKSNVKIARKKTFLKSLISELENKMNYLKTYHPLHINNLQDDIDTQSKNARREDNNIKNL